MRSLRPNFLSKINQLTANIQFLKKVERELTAQHIPVAQYEAETLVQHFGKMNRLDFFVGQKVFTQAAKRNISRALHKRLKGTPLPYILKEAPFFGRSFFVTPNVLIPRPETELLAQEALRLLKDYKMKAPRVLDIGTGTGCLAIVLTAECRDCRMTAVEISKKAFAVARKNLSYHGLDKKIKLVKGDLFSAFGKAKKGYWDLIVSNPPYIPQEDFDQLPVEVKKEPRLALDGGPKGLAVIDRLLEQAPYFLKKKAWLIVEIGQGQAQMIQEKIQRQKMFKKIKLFKDFAGIDRVLLLQNG